MRLIDADKLGLTDFEIFICAGDYKEALKLILSKIDNAPTIEAVPVVRCKDCKYMKVSEYHYKDIGYRSTDCTRGNEGVIGTYGDSGYCSLAERKTEP